MTPRTKIPSSRFHPQPGGARRDTGQGSLALTLVYIATNPTTYIPAMLTWVREGFRPSYAALQNTS